MLYIKEIIKQFTCQKLKKEINISVNSATYNQVYEHFLSHNSSRKAEHNSREITKLYFLLMLFISTAYYKSKNEDTGEDTNVLKREINLLNKDISYDGLSDTKFKSLKKALDNNDMDNAQIIIDELIEDTQKNIED